MDSLRQHQSNYDPLFFGPSYSENRRRGSTSQMSLHKILSIITSVPPPLAAAAPQFSGSETKESSAEYEKSDANKGLEIDLNVGLCISPEPNESFDSGQSSNSNIALEGEGSAARGRGCFDVNHENPGDRVENVERGNEVPENSDINIEEEEKRLTILIEAAKLIFGEFVDNEESKCGKQSASRCSELKKDEVTEDIEPSENKLGRRGSCLMPVEMGEEFEQTPSSPVVRSRRGRTQVLPGKYRDSVLEPLTGFSRTRGSFLPSKRRRRWKR